MNSNVLDDCLSAESRSFQRLYRRPGRPAPPSWLWRSISLAEKQNFFPPSLCHVARHEKSSGLLKQSQIVRILRLQGAYEQIKLGQAAEALGDRKEAAKNYRKALQINASSRIASDGLRRVGGDEA